MLNESGYGYRFRMLVCATAASLLAITSALQAATPQPVRSPSPMEVTTKSNNDSVTKREHSNGAPKTDGFGTTLPAGFSKQTIIDLLAPGEDTSLATLVGAKPWGGAKNTYVAIVCLAQDAEMYQQLMMAEPNKGVCQSSYNRRTNTPARPKVFLGVLAYAADGWPPALIATYGKALDTRVGWQNSNLLAPDVDATPSLLPDFFARFDLAPYRINDANLAFGVRMHWFAGYAGGGAGFEALLLFAIIDGRVVNILSEPISYQQTIAGSWNEDGTRDHEESEGYNIVRFLPHKTHGHYDLQIKAKGEKWSRTFKWNDNAQQYRVKVR